MEKRVDWVHLGADCREAIIEKSSALWREIVTEIEAALTQYEERCGLEGPVVVEDRSFTDRAFRAVLRRNPDDGTKELLEVAVSYATRSEPATRINATWKRHPSNIFDGGPKEQWFTVSTCREDGALVLMAGQTECSAAQLAERILKQQLFGGDSL